MTSTAARAGIFERLDTVILRVRDLEASRAWYERVLELRAAFTAPNIVVFDLGGGPSLTLERAGDTVTFRVPFGAEASSYPIFYAADLDAARRHLIACGVPVDDVGEDGPVRYFGFRDPDGNLVQVCHFPQG